MRLSRFGNIKLRFQLPLLHGKWLLAILNIVFLAAQIDTPEVVYAKTEETKGLLPELRLDSQNENVNDEKAMTSEIMIAKTENAAVEALKKIIKTKKGQPDEPDLWFRLAEMYMRRSKSGRFFDLNLNQKTKALTSFPIVNEKGTDSIKKAIEIFNKIETSFPKFTEMDQVCFTSGFANQQIGKFNEAIRLYSKLIKTFQSSSVIPDGTLALAELYYDHGKFSEALPYFLALEKYPESRVHNYGLYKTAWTYYNLNQSAKAVETLIRIVKANKIESTTQHTGLIKQNLRKEALRDLAVFVSDSYTADKLYDFFIEIASEDELGDIILNLGAIYESHSKFKELNLLVTDFIKRQPLHKDYVRASVLTLESNENLKDRKKVISILKELSAACRSDSSWAKIQTTEVLESAKKEFHTTSLDIAKKWWDIWLKNKQNKEFSSLTEQSLRIILENDDPLAPDFKTRYALAELLFQNENFEEASQNYFKAAAASTDIKLKHDSNYAALFSYEKFLDLNKESVTSKNANKAIAQERLKTHKELATNYVQTHPKGIFSEPVKFKLGLLAYQEGDYSEAEKWLKPIASNSGEKGPKKPDQIQLEQKAEDLLLDIRNILKDYKGLQATAKDVLSHTFDSYRKMKINQIIEEASFKEIQGLAQNEDKEPALKRLIEFAQPFSKDSLSDNSKPSISSQISNKNLPHSKDQPQKSQNKNLIKESHWQALSLAFSMGKSIQGAELSLAFAEKYSDDEKALDALKEAANQYTESGMLLKAADILSHLSEIYEVREPEQSEKFLEAAADIYSIEKQNKKARNLYIACQSKIKTLKKSNDSITNQARLLQKIAATLDPKTDKKELQSYDDSVLSLGVEPQTTEILIKKLKEIYSLGRSKEAFEMALKINSRPVDASVKAPARLIQAKILESELVAQSIKTTNINKLSMVLSMKTEKLDKAQTAYLSATKMSNTPAIVLDSLQGMDRCYENYLNSLKTLTLPDSVAPEEQKAVRDELEKIIFPITEKKNENLAKLNELTKQVGSLTSGTGIETDNFEQAILVGPVDSPYRTVLTEKILGRITSKFKPFLPGGDDWSFSSLRVEKIDKKINCSGDIVNTSLPALYPQFAQCYFSGDLATAQKIANYLAGLKKTRSQGLYYLSLISEKNQNIEKAQVLLDKALKYQSDNPLLYYEKGRLASQNQNTSLAISFFEKAIDMQMSFSELQTFDGLNRFRKGDFTSAYLKLSVVPPEEVYNLGVTAIVSECYGQSNEFDRGWKLLKELSSSHPTDSELLLVKLTYFENFKKASRNEILSSYRDALKIKDISEQNIKVKNWIDQKVSFLSPESEKKPAPEVNGNKREIASDPNAPAVKSSNSPSQKDLNKKGAEK